MILTFRPIKVWPEGWREPKDRPRSPFSASYSSTLKILEREVEHLEPRDDPLLQVDASARDLRLDGQLRADAKVGHPGVIVTIDSRRYGTLTYPCDAFEGHWKEPGWQANLRAVALGLEALRRVERYGIAQRGQQYAGYRELGTGIALGQGAMTREEAADFLIAYGEWGDVAAELDDILDAGPDVIDSYYRHAAKTLHPDAGGDPDLFRRLTQARDLLAPKGS